MSASRDFSLSRRQVLQGATVTAGAVAAAMAASSPAQAKMAQTAAGYQDKPKGDQSCGSCALFSPPASCSLVDGSISPNGWCRFYSKKS